ncbi:MAG: NUDIX domain-containing protein [Bacillota bacterium]|nr:MAG: NUDIX domain-containing protein [Bacillota bacterium]
MINITPMIIEEGLIENGTVKERKTVRAIITNEQHEVLLVYSKLFEDYTFPGGGIKENETDIDCLKRELNEEIGAVDLTVYEPLFSIDELRYGVKGSDNVYLQNSTYYRCQIHTFGEQNLQGRELAHGITPIWVSIDKALVQNEKVLPNSLHQTKGLKTVLIRENRILKALKEILK